MWRWRTIAPATAILVSLGVVYFPALTAGYLWDDAVYVTDNPSLRSLAGLGDIWRVPPITRQYYPLTFTTFWIEHHLWGNAPFGYHLINVVLHAVNALLLWRLLALLHIPGAFLAAWIFALHPVHVESVAWIAERKNVLSGCFALLTTLAWMRFLSARRVYRFALVVILFALALLSKSQTCTLPLALALITWLTHPNQVRRALPHLVLLGLMGIAAATITVHSEWDGGAVVALPELHWLERVQVAGRAVWFYLAKLLWPSNLMAIYGHWNVDRHAYGLYAFPLTAAVLPIALWSARRRLGLGPCVAVLMFLVSLAPTLGLIDFNFMRYAFVADHFQYLASMPIIALAAAGGVSVARGSRSDLGLAALVLGALATISWLRAAVHHDEESLWRDNIERHPNCIAAYNHLGTALAAQRRFDEAMGILATAARLDPGDARAYVNMGDVLVRQERWREAIAQYNDALRRDPSNPATHNSLGVALHAAGDNEVALEHFAAAVRFDPTSVVAHTNWATTLVAIGRSTDALEHFAAAVAIDPSRAKGRMALGLVLLELGHVERAIDELRAACTLESGSAAAHHRLGMALGIAGRTADALAELTLAAHLDPNDAEIQNHWGVALAQSGRREDARLRFEAALRLHPDFSEARDNLARVSSHEPPPPTGEE